jgi:hypothetical protein
VTLAPDTTTISTLQVRARGFKLVDNVLTVSIAVNRQLTVNVMNSANIDTVFDVIVQDRSHVFVSDAVPVVVNNVRSFYIQAKKAGNSRISIVGR